MSKRAFGARTSGNLLVNNQATWWPNGCESPVTSGGFGCDDPAMVWGAGPGQGLAYGGSHMDTGYGYGSIGPNGPDSGNLPGPLPAAWWNRFGSNAGELPPGVTRATEIITSPINRNRWEIVRDGAPSGDRLPHWVADPMGAAPVQGPSQATLPASQRLTSHDFWGTFLTHALWFGRGVLLYEINDSGRPIAGTFQIINPFLMHDMGEAWVLGFDTEHELVFDFDGRATVGGRQFEMKVLRGMPPHGESDYFGGVLIRHARTFGVAVKVASYEANVFNTGIPAGVLEVSTPNFDADRAAKLRQSWEAAHGGDKRGIAILNANVKFSPVSLNPVEADLSKLKGSNLVDQAHAFGISASWLDTAGGDSLTYANLVDRRRDLVDHTLAEWGASIMQTLSTMLPAGQELRIRWRDYTAADFSKTLDDAIKGVASGLLTVDEGRELIDYARMDGGLNA